MLTRPLLTLERVDVCKRDGMLLSEPSEPPPVDFGAITAITAPTANTRGRCAVAFPC